MYVHFLLVYFDFFYFKLLRKSHQVVAEPGLLGGRGDLLPQSLGLPPLGLHPLSDLLPDARDAEEDRGADLLRFPKHEIKKKYILNLNFLQPIHLQRLQQRPLEGRLVRVVD